MLATKLNFGKNFCSNHGVVAVSKIKEIAYCAIQIWK
jgi:hypothetical protein